MTAIMMHWKPLMLVFVTDYDITPMPAPSASSAPLEIEMIPLATHLDRKRAKMAIARAACLGCVVSWPMPGAAQTAPSSPSTPPSQLQPSSNVVLVKPAPSQPDWSKACAKDATGKIDACFTTRDFVSQQGQPALAVAVYDVKGGPQGGMRFVRVLLPLGVLMAPGIRAVIDQGQTLQGQFSACMATGCFAEIPALKDETIAQLGRGEKLVLTSTTVAGRELSFQVPLAGFGKAFDGPPIDASVLAEQQRRSQEEADRRTSEMLRKLNSGTEAGSNPSTSPPKP